VAGRWLAVGIGYKATTPGYITNDDAGREPWLCKRRRWVRSLAIGFMAIGCMADCFGFGLGRCGLNYQAVAGTTTSATTTAGTTTTAATVTTIPTATAIATQQQQQRQ